MAMSRDRVRFVLGNRRVDSGLKKAFSKAFKTDLPEVRHEDQYEIICRPSQFARFLIYRNEEGCPNGFKELEAQLFTPEASVVKTLDVSMKSNE